MDEEQKEQRENKLKSLIAPDVEMRKATRKMINDYAYYVMIVLISLLVVFIPPLVMGSVVGNLETVLPKTPVAWAVWIILNVSTAIGNMSILVFFKLQARKNSESHPNYKKACEILNRLAGKKEVFIPRSPRAMNAKEYASKSVCICISTVTSFFTISALMINFQVMALISCLLSMIIAIIISWTTMLKNEQYWTEEYLLYAEMIERKLSKKGEEEQC